MDRNIADARRLLAETPESLWPERDRRVQEHVADRKVQCRLCGTKIEVGTLLRFWPTRFSPTGWGAVHAACGQAELEREYGAMDA